MAGLARTPVLPEAILAYRPFPPFRDRRAEGRSRPFSALEDRPYERAVSARKRSSAEGVGCANTVIRWWRSDEPVRAERTSRKAGQVAAGKRLSRQAMWGAAMD